MSTTANTNQLVTKSYDSNYMIIFRKVEGSGTPSGYGGNLECDDVYSVESPYENNKKSSSNG